MNPGGAAPGDSRGIRVRRGAEGDLAGLVALEEASFTADRLSRRSLRRLLLVRTADVLLAEGPGGALLGAAVLLRRKGSHRERLYSLAVDPAARGRGVGRLLLEAVLAGARSRGVVEVGLEVRTDNDGAIALYRSLGFTEAGVVEGYYADGAPALVMRRVEGER